MTSNIMIAIYILAVLLVILIGWIIRLEIKINRLLRGKKSINLEDSILHIVEELKDLHSFKDVSKKYYEDVERRLKRSIQAVETVRFNPFRGTGDGGNQSFAISFTNEHGDGVVVSSLNARDRLSLFSKPLKKYSSDFELSDEESDVVARARKTTEGK
ncbi:DUF4446 family protein [Candidatus Parcubacteria bacterium]|nr:DUF4446 family protein [Candidatus Parcubacteria bacterium]